MTEQPIVIIAAGGTGGHMFPAEAFAHEMKSRGWRIGLMSDERGNRYAGNFPLDWSEQVTASTISSKRPDRLLSSALKIRKGVGEARRKLKALDADLVAGFGGYPAFPAMSAAASLGIPMLIHEQNAVLGRVNRHFAKRANTIACGFDRLDRLPRSARGRKRVVGNPVRPPMIEARDAPYPSVVPGASLKLLVIGGSQGAKILGDVIPQAIVDLDPALRSRIEIVQQVREEQIEEVKAVYETAGVRSELSPFFSNMAHLLANAHLVLARSGASSVTELQVVGRPSILIPLAIATDNHQLANAASLVEAGASDVITEREFTVAHLSKVLSERLADGPSLAKRAQAAKSLGRPDAAQKLADIAQELVKVSA